MKYFPVSLLLSLALMIAGIVPSAYAAVGDPCTNPGDFDSACGGGGFCDTTSHCAAFEQPTGEDNNGGISTRTTNSNPNNNQVQSGPNTTSEGVQLVNPLGAGTSVKALIADIMKIVVQIGTVVVIFMLVWVGFLFVTARGEPGKITEAREALCGRSLGHSSCLGRSDSNRHPVDRGCDTRRIMTFLNSSAAVK